MELGRQSGKDIQSFLDNLKTWRPEEVDYNNFEHENAKRSSVVFFFFFADKLLIDKGVDETYGSWPSSYFLFKILPEDKDERNKLLQDYIKLLFDPRLVDALGHWIYSTYDEDKWRKWLESNNSPPSTQIGLIQYNFAKLRKLSVENILKGEEKLDPGLWNTLISDFLIKDIKQKQMNIFIHWVAILSFRKTEKNELEGNEVAICLIKALFQYIDKKRRKEIREELKKMAWVRLEDANRSQDKSEKDKLRAERRLFKFILKNFNVNNF